MNIAKHRCMHYLSMKENWSQMHCLIYIYIYIYIYIDPIKMKFMIKTKLKLFKRTQKDIYIIFNLFLDFFNRLLTWRQSSYSHIPIPYNHEIVNVIKIQNSPL